MSGLVERIAEVLAAHYHWYDGDCGDSGLCEAEETCPKYEHLTLDAARDAHAAHQAEQVRAVLGETTTEWGVRVPGPRDVPYGSEGNARAVAGLTGLNPWPLLRREVTPWTEVPR